VSNATSDFAAMCHGAAPGQPCERCGRRHRNWHQVAKCFWRGSEWVSGNPIGAVVYALVSYCPRGVTVTLWADLDEAQRQKRCIDAGKCGGRCVGNRRIHRLGGGE
jgi:hypothetical protein